MTATSTAHGSLSADASRTTGASVRRGTRRERLVTSTTELIAYGAKKLMRDRAQQLAAALAYRTVFSLVPILVLALVAVRAVSSPEDLQHRLHSLLKYLALSELSFELPPNGASGTGATRVALSDLIDQFATNQLSQMGDLNFGAIAAVGVGILIYAAISLVVQVEQAFNVICGAPSGRRLVSRLVNYWTLLTLGSVALYLSFTLSGRFAAILGEMPAWLDWATLPVQLAVKVGVTWLLLMFAYLQMPNTRVRLRPAAIGAIVAACLWEIAKSGLTWFVSNATEGKVSVYGSLALLPIFLLWIYVTWLIVLFGLELASILQTLRNASILDRRLTPRRQAPTILDASVALQALAEMARGFREGRATRLDDLAAKLGMSEEQAAMLATAAVNAGLVHAIERELEPDIFALARPAETIKLRDAFAVLDRLSPAPLDESAKAALRELRDRQRAPLMDLTLASLIDDAPAESGGAGGAA